MRNSSQNIIGLHKPKSLLIIAYTDFVEGLPKYFESCNSMH